MLTFYYFYLIRLNDITYKLGTKCTHSTVINLLQSHSLHNCLKMYDSLLFSAVSVSLLQSFK